MSKPLAFEFVAIIGCAWRSFLLPLHALRPRRLGDNMAARIPSRPDADGYAAKHGIPVSIRYDHAPVCATVATAVTAWAAERNARSKARVRWCRTAGTSDWCHRCP